jgi:hypothetical protein
MKHLTSLIALTLLPLAFAGCSKNPPNAAGARLEVYDFGVVEVSDGIPNRHDLGGGRVCIITPAIQKDGSVLLSMRVEESGKVVQLMRAQTRSDMQFQISGGGLSIAMNPHIKQ